MKRRLIAMITVATLAFALTACGGKKDNKKEQPSAPTENTNQDNTNQDNTTPDTTPDQTPVVTDGDALDVLTAVWNLFDENTEKFAIYGGSFEASVDDAPGAVDVSLVDTLTYQFYLPASYSDKITTAATIMHAYNANTFTAVAVTTGDVAGLASTVADELPNVQWVCGAPEKYLVATVDGCVVYTFGAAECVDTFKAHLTEAYPTAAVVAEDEIAMDWDF